MAFYLVSAVMKPDLSKDLEREEEDYCTPPLAQERAVALDRFFERLSVTPVQAGEG